MNNHKTVVNFPGQNLYLLKLLGQKSKGSEPMRLVAEIAVHDKVV